MNNGSKRGRVVLRHLCIAIVPIDDAATLSTFDVLRVNCPHSSDPWQILKSAHIRIASRTPEHASQANDDCNNHPADGEAPECKSTIGR